MNCISLQAVKEVEIEKELPNDPFTKHFQNDLSEELLVSLSNTLPTVEHVTKTCPVLRNISITIPKPIETAKKLKAKVSILEKRTYAALGTAPQSIQNIDFNQLHIKSQIHSNIVSANKKNLIKKDLELIEIFTPLQKDLFTIINNYQDMYYPERTFTNADEIRYIYCLHVVNHMLKTRTKILHHNAKLAKKPDLSDDCRDQGLVRPKVYFKIYLHS